MTHYEVTEQFTTYLYNDILQKHSQRELLPLKYSEAYHFNLIEKTCTPINSRLIRKTMFMPTKEEQRSRLKNLSTDTFDDNVPF